MDADLAAHPIALVATALHNDIQETGTCYTNATVFSSPKDNAPVGCYVPTDDSTVSPLQALHSCYFMEY